ncbi:hypothetical protein AMELA_G00115080 [Ameiurus melas]|uniref:Zinc-ribbon domain-containing protein n=1 Tax=Ameiurus melas TaxID=219545 RepID=A0A7J6AR55_AMEME|nr:hypothetical protein AMELA_G00115080 [Ameiurus melas]
MQCPKCGFVVKESFRFCPGCGCGLSTQPSSTTGGKSPEQLAHQEKEAKRNQAYPDIDANSSSGHCNEFPGDKEISNPGLRSSQTDTNQDKDDYASERTHNEISTIQEDVPQDGASLSSEKATEDKARLSIDAASQKHRHHPMSVIECLPSLIKHPFQIFQASHFQHHLE